jgi:hypothetical protein
LDTDFTLLRIREKPLRIAGFFRSVVGSRKGNAGDNVAGVSVGEDY